MASLLPDICAKVGTITIKPSETDLVKLAEKGNYSPAPFLDKTMGRLGKILEKLKANSSQPVKIDLNKKSLTPKKDYSKPHY